jgi:hypothetical protein
MKIKRRRRCPWCGRMVSLTGTNKLWHHLRYSTQFGGGLPPRCEGAGREPEEHQAAKGGPS